MICVSCDVGRGFPGVTVSTGDGEPRRHAQPIFAHMLSVQSRQKRQPCELNLEVRRTERNETFIQFTFLLGKSFCSFDYYYHVYIYIYIYIYLYIYIYIYIIYSEDASAHYIFIGRLLLE